MGRPERLTWLISMVLISWLYGGATQQLSDIDRQTIEHLVGKPVAIVPLPNASRQHRGHGVTTPIDSHAGHDHAHSHAGHDHAHSHAGHAHANTGTSPQSPSHGPATFHVDRPGEDGNNTPFVVIHRNSQPSRPASTAPREPSTRQLPVRAGPRARSRATARTVASFPVESRANEMNRIDFSTLGLVDTGNRYVPSEEVQQPRTPPMHTTLTTVPSEFHLGGRSPMAGTAGFEGSVASPFAERSFRPAGFDFPSGMPPPYSPGVREFSMRPYYSVAPRVPMFPRPVPRPGFRPPFPGMPPTFGRPPFYGPTPATEEEMVARMMRRRRRRFRRRRRRMMRYQMAMAMGVPMF